MNYEELEIMINYATKGVRYNTSSVPDTHLSKQSFCEQYKTVRLSLHRMIGHTTYIMKQSKNVDFIYTTHPKHYKGFSNVRRSCKIKDSLQAHNIQPETIWIDNASFFTKSDLRKIYKQHTADCIKRESLPLFVLLG